MSTKVATSREVISGRVAFSTPSMQPSRLVSRPGISAPRDVPLFIPASQAYYWSAAWQEGEAESRANLMAGNSRTFDNPLDAIRYLLDDC
ncbi:MAG TPA: hypothetical protein VHA54_07200 [Solirubrobacterales bacterium]|nr:hypothetical protein [Solirubrobacterales bacterium]